MGGRVGRVNSKGRGRSPRHTPPTRRKMVSWKKEREEVKEKILCSGMREKSGCAGA